MAGAPVGGSELLRGRPWRTTACEGTWRCGSGRGGRGALGSRVYGDDWWRGLSDGSSSGLSEDDTTGTSRRRQWHISVDMDASNRR